MKKQRGSPDQRGMGAQSDFLSETFAPGQEHRAEQLRRARYLIANGFSPEQAARMLSISIELVQKNG